MGWTKRYAQAKSLGIGVFHVRRDGKTNGRVMFGGATVKAWGLKNYKSVDGYNNDKTPSVIAFQFRTDDEGEWRVCCPKAGSAYFNFSEVLEAAGAEPGHYQAHLEKPGYVTADLGLARLRGHRSQSQESR